MLILWSGGCDSTQLIFWHARQAVANGTEAPRSLAVNYTQVPCCSQQKRSRERLLKEFARRNLPVAHTELTLSADGYAKCQPGEGGSGLVQPTSWISLAQPFLAEKEDLHLGYIRGDDIWHYKSDLFAAFEAAQRLLKKTGSLCLDYEWWPKYEIIKSLRQEKLLDLVWYCEDRNVSKPCGLCPSCRSMKTGLMLESDSIEAEKWRVESSKPYTRKPKCRRKASKG